MSGEESHSTNSDGTREDATRRPDAPIARPISIPSEAADAAEGAKSHSKAPGARRTQVPEGRHLHPIRTHRESRSKRRNAKPFVVSFAPDVGGGASSQEPMAVNGPQEEVAEDDKKEEKDEEAPSEEEAEGSGRSIAGEEEEEEALGAPPAFSSAASATAPRPASGSAAAGTTVGDAGAYDDASQEAAAGEGVPAAPGVNPLSPDALQTYLDTGLDPPRLEGRPRSISADSGMLSTTHRAHNATPAQELNYLRWGAQFLMECLPMLSRTLRWMVNIRKYTTFYECVVATDDDGGQFWWLADDSPTAANTPPEAAEDGIMAAPKHYVYRLMKRNVDIRMLRCRGYKRLPQPPSGEDKGANYIQLRGIVSGLYTWESYRQCQRQNRLDEFRRVFGVDAPRSAELSKHAWLYGLCAKPNFSKEEAKQRCADEAALQRERERTHNESFRHDKARRDPFDGQNTRRSLKVARAQEQTLSDYWDEHRPPGTPKGLASREAPETVDYDDEDYNGEGGEYQEAELDEEASHMPACAARVVLKPQRKNGRGRSADPRSKSKGSAPEPPGSKRVAPAASASAAASGGSSARAPSRVPGDHLSDQRYKETYEKRRRTLAMGVDQSSSLKDKQFEEVLANLGQREDPEAIEFISQYEDAEKRHYDAMMELAVTASECAYIQVNITSEYDSVNLRESRNRAQSAAGRLPPPPASRLAPKSASEAKVEPAGPKAKAPTAAKSGGSTSAPPVPPANVSNKAPPPGKPPAAASGSGAVARDHVAEAKASHAAGPSRFFDYDGRRAKAQAPPQKKPIDGSDHVPGMIAMPKVSNAGSSAQGSKARSEGPSRQPPQREERSLCFICRQPHDVRTCPTCMKVEDPPLKIDNVDVRKRMKEFMRDGDIKPDSSGWQTFIRVRNAARDILIAQGHIDQGIYQEEREALAARRTSRQNKTTNDVDSRSAPGASRRDDRDDRDEGKGGGKGPSGRAKPVSHESANEATRGERTVGQARAPPPGAKAKNTEAYDIHGVRRPPELAHRHALGRDSEQDVAECLSDGCLSPRSLAQRQDAR